MPKCHQVVLDIRKVDQCHLLQVFSRVTHLANKGRGVVTRNPKEQRRFGFQDSWGSSETVAKGPNKFDEIFHGVKPEIRAAFFFEKKNNQPNEPTNSWKISLLPEFLRSFGQKVFSKNGSFLATVGSFFFPTRIPYLKKRYQMLPSLCKQRFLPFLP